MATSNFKLASLFHVTSLVLILVHVFFPSNIEADMVFNLDLIHRDSPLSPFYNPSKTDVGRLNDAFLRSISRINYFQLPKELEYLVVPGDGEYFMKYSIGTPKVEQFGIADTGSDLIWTQCMPCQECFKQKPSLYDPRPSPTYIPIPYASPYCDALGDFDKLLLQPNDQCGFLYAYGDGESRTTGDLATQNFIISPSNGPDPLSLMDLVFGCAHDFIGDFPENASGIIGLGVGPLSLISQMSPLIKGKFSYCLAHTTKHVTSKITFGDMGLDPTSPSVVSTPLIVVNKGEPYYRITLEAISVGDKRLPYSGSSDIDPPQGNMIVDIGSTYTYLNRSLLEKLVEALVDEFGSKTLEWDGRVCFNVSSADVPMITFHFSGGDVKLQTLNTFFERDDQAMCLGMLPQPQETSFDVFGVWGQANFVVGYDILEKKRIFFMP